MSLGAFGSVEEQNIMMAKLLHDKEAKLLERKALRSADLFKGIFQLIYIPLGPVSYMYLHLPIAPPYAKAVLCVVNFWRTSYSTQ